MRCRLQLNLLAAALLLAAAAPAQDDPALAQQELEQLRERVEGLERKLERQSTKRDRVQAELRDAELAEAAARSELAAVRKKLEASQARLEALESERDRRRQELAAEIDTLARQVRAAYVTGQREWLQVALSGSDPLQTSRELVYYRYLGAYRREVVAKVRERVQELVARAKAVSAEKKQLAQLEQAQADRVEDLSGHRKDRSRVLARLDERIRGRTGEIERLRREAEDLEQLVSELRRAIESLPVDDSAPFAGRKGAMDWPAAGKPLRQFGEARGDGQLRWEGTMLEAPAGSEVRAIHRGRVVFADWLQGLGLLAVVEHGDGYLSLYGHNRDLLKDVGDWVSTGEVLGHVGDSGGRAESGLYFEIRKDGRPVDPAPWMR